METSLTGKALDFGSNEYGFESHVSNLYNYYLNYVLNKIKINQSKKSLYFDIIFSKKNLIIIKLLQNLGMIRRFYIIKIKNKNLKIRIFILFYKNLPLFLDFKLISKPSISFYISLNALSLLNKRTLNSVFLLSTNFGIITHKEALKLNTGGRLLASFSL